MIDASIFGVAAMSELVNFPKTIASPADQQTPDDFSDHPVSITSKRATNENDGSLQTPRDVLINKLRDIDSGKINPYALVVLFGEKNEEGVSTGFEAGGGDSHTLLGVVTRGLHKMLTGQDNN